MVKLFPLVELSKKCNMLLKYFMGFERTKHLSFCFRAVFEKGCNPESTHQSRDPEGYTYQSSDPEGCTYQSSAPEGCTYQSSAPEGCTYQSSAPAGCTYP
ncbi:NBS-LRR type resistance protein [Cucumis melo var. makuwa]|uniref:NBS-LRR type resistance protein n=1 Tax=Cucumis melo var. makuwa TaxID=1194695 RepID=A0A5D3E3I0_CUCMM|nr:NBS-LRR type resistance protein [Cucumis melo var. makuwa]